MQRGGGLLRSEFEEWEDLLHDTEEGLELVMDILSIDAAPEIIKSSVRLFVIACLERNREELRQFVKECLTLTRLA